MNPSAENYENYNDPLPLTSLSCLIMDNVSVICLNYRRGYSLIRLLRLGLSLYVLVVQNKSSVARDLLVYFCIYLVGQNWNEYCSYE